MGKLLVISAISLTDLSRRDRGAQSQLAFQKTQRLMRPMAASEFGFVRPIFLRTPLCHRDRILRVRIAPRTFRTRNFRLSDAPTTFQHSQECENVAAGGIAHPASPPRPAARPAAPGAPKPPPPPPGPSPFRYRPAFPRRRPTSH